MTNTKFDPGKILGDKIVNLSRQELCELGSRLCRYIKDEVGTRQYRGGIFPQNISVDENGEPAIGPASKNDWDGQELDFLAPELYWNSKKSQTSDVYSIGLLLYYALNKGKLPYEGECDNPQLRRMNGEDFPAPRAAGRRLGEIIIKATHFKPEDRYKNVEEMAIMLDNCVKNLYLDGAPSSEVIFNKDEDNLSDIERLMVDIIEKGVEDPVEEVCQEESPAEPLQEEKTEISTEEKSSEPEKAEEAAKEFDEKEEVKVYEPVKAKKPKRSAPKRQPVPILTVDENPELEPVILPSQNIKPAVQYGKSAQREKKIAAEVKKKSGRPLVAVLIVCAVIVVAAIVVNALLNDLSWRKENQEFNNSQNVDNLPVVKPDGSTSVGIVDLPSGFIETPPPSAGIAVENDTPDPSLPTATPPAEGPKEHRYEVFKEDISWKGARDKCMEKGGYLVVINDQEELDKVISIAKAAGLERVWIGCHRINDVLVWESGEDVSFFPAPWGTGSEPSYVDSYDGTKEDYLMLWNNNGWQYNDNRNDPVADYPQFYKGTIGYICEYTN